jgi:hypothetical protein
MEILLGMNPESCPLRLSGFISLKILFMVQPKSSRGQLSGCLTKD